MADNPLSPSLLWRASSTTVMGIIGTLTRVFMHGPNWQDAHGLDGFLELLDERADIDGRQRGLITGMREQQIKSLNLSTEPGFAVSNHICVYVRITNPEHQAPPLQKLIDAIL